MGRPTNEVLLQCQVESTPQKRLRKKPQNRQTVKSEECLACDSTAHERNGPQRSRGPQNSRSLRRKTTVQVRVRQRNICHAHKYPQRAMSSTSPGQRKPKRRLRTPRRV